MPAACRTVALCSEPRRCSLRQAAPFLPATVCVMDQGNRSGRPSGRLLPFSCRALCTGTSPLRGGLSGTRAPSPIPAPAGTSRQHPEPRSSRWGPGSFQHVSRTGGAWPFLPGSLCPSRSDWGHLSCLSVCSTQRLGQPLALSITNDAVIKGSV